MAKSDLVNQINSYINNNQPFFEKLFIDMDRRRRQFHKINNARIRVALENFSPEMKYALYEVLFFLHVNSQNYSEYQYKVFSENTDSKNNPEPENNVANLYVPGAPYGVAGIRPLDPLINDSFTDYCSQQFDIKQIPVFESNTFLSICSIGSIGTIAHKPDRSDLDIQVQYDLFPPDIPEEYMSHSHILEMLLTVNQMMSENNPGSKSRKPDHTINPDLICRYVKFHFGALLEFFMNRQPKNKTELTPKMIARLIFEIERLYRTHVIITKKNELKVKEFLIQKKIKLIRQYLSKRFPAADIYFFSYTTDNYKRGQHGTTKKSKEASGTAYELILNYETLLPGIQFNHIVPSHYLFNDALNENTAKYLHLISLMRLGSSKSLSKLKNKYVDLGNTPYITKKYVIDHFGAVYWEAFKASQGNLAKAILNLLRFEVLMWKEVSPTIINCIKDRSLYSTSKKIDKSDEFGLNIPLNKMFTQFDISETESKIPNLVYDPWWLRYKILKSSYDHSPGLITPNEARQISGMIDICFAIHIYLGDIIDESVQNGKNMDINYRNNFLHIFYDNAFPLFSQNREKIIRIFAGDTDEIRKLEKEMKHVFYNCIQRVEFHSKINSNRFTGNREEFQIWFHYFKKYFNPPPNMIQTGILQNHKQQRNRLIINYRDKQWYYSTIYEKDSAKHEFMTIADKQGMVELFRHQSFLYGFAYCLLNNYFRVARKDSIGKVLSTVEVNFTKYNEQKDKVISRLPQDGVDRIGRFILKKFVKFPVDYRDTLNPDKIIYDMCIFLNLMIFGKVDILYRDTLNNWYYSGATIDVIRGKSKHYFENAGEFLKHPNLVRYIHDFCIQSNMNPSTMLSKLYIWVNPSSLSAQGSTDQRLQSFESMLKENLRKYIAGSMPENKSA